MTDVLSDCTDQADYTCRSFLTNECLLPLTRECQKLINGDSFCRNLSKNFECHSIASTDKICRNDKNECY